MPGSDPLHFQILGGIAGQLEHLSSEVLQDGGAVDGGGGANPAVAGGPALEVPVDPTNRELESGPGRPENIECCEEDFKEKDFIRN